MITLLSIGLSLWLGSLCRGDDGKRYAIQADQSTFTVKVGRAGLLKVFGHDHHIEVRRYKGEVVWRPEVRETSSVRMEIEAASLKVADPKIEESDRQKIQSDMESKVLEIGTYPTILFESKELRIEKENGEEYQAILSGVLTLHGVTREVEIPLRFQVSNEKLRTWGKLKIKGSEFGIQPVSVAGGTVKTKDELEFRFDLVAIRG